MVATRFVCELRVLTTTLAPFTLHPHLFTLTHLPTPSTHTYYHHHQIIGDAIAEQSDAEVARPGGELWPLDGDGDGGVVGDDDAGEGLTETTVRRVVAFLELQKDHPRFRLRRVRGGWGC